MRASLMRRPARSLRGDSRRCAEQATRAAAELDGPWKGWAAEFLGFANPLVDRGRLESDASSHRGQSQNRLSLRHCASVPTLLGQYSAAQERKLTLDSVHVTPTYS